MSGYAIDQLKGHGGTLGAPPRVTIAAVADRDVAWKQDANCRTYDREIFFPSAGESNLPAKAICASCKVRRECLQYAIDHMELHGVWGGKGERERRRMRAVRRLR